MDYSLMAGSLVTTSLILLVIETHFCRLTGGVGAVFVYLYALGVISWLLLGLIMNQVALVFISMLQLLCIALFWSMRERESGK